MKHHYISKEKLEELMECQIENARSDNEAKLVSDLLKAFKRTLIDVVPVDYVLEDPNPLEVNR